MLAGPRTGIVTPLFDIKRPIVPGFTMLNDAVVISFKQTNIQ